MIRHNDRRIIFIKIYSTTRKMLDELLTKRKDINFNDKNTEQFE